MKNNKHITTHFKITDPRRNWDISERFNTQEDAHAEMLKMQVRQKEKGFTPDRCIIIKVETEKHIDKNGEFLKSVVTETRV